MRPDTRSFSFTFLKGQQHQQELNLGRARGKNPNIVSSGSIRLEEESIQTENNMNVQQRCNNLAKLRNFRASSIWNPKKYVAIDENDVQTDEDLDDPPVKKDSDTSDTASGSKSSLSGSLGRRINRTMQDVKNSFDSLSQILRRSTRRRYRMTSPMTNEISPTRRMLGRTPTKLYSPFGFDSPAQKTPLGLGHNPITPRRVRSEDVSRIPYQLLGEKRYERREVSPSARISVCQRVCGLGHLVPLDYLSRIREIPQRRPLTPGRVYSPTNTFKRDVKEARRGLRELHLLSRDITRRSVRF